jgi:hypothetical protein
VNPLIPANDLDRAIKALTRSPSAMPEFYRALTAGDANGEIWFLMPFHPEFEDQKFCLQEGSPLPFAVMKDEKGEIAMLFSSEERLEEGLERGKVPPRTFLAGSMPAKQALEILGATGLRAVINRSCTTGSIIIGPDMMRDLASGEALKPLGLGICEPVTRRLGILDPADYPTFLIQPLFEMMRQHGNFRAAWIFGPPKDAPPSADLPAYYVLTLMEPPDEKLFHDFNIVVQSAKGKRCKVELSLTNPADTEEIAKLFRSAPPFFKAADYQPPG